MRHLQAAAAEQLTESGALARVQDLSVSADLVAMSDVAEQIHAMIATPEFQRFVAEQRKGQRSSSASSP